MSLGVALIREDSGGTLRGGPMLWAVCVDGVSGVGLVEPQVATGAAGVRLEKNH